MFCVFSVDKVQLSSSLRGRSGHALDLPMDVHVPIKVIACTMKQTTLFPRRHLHVAEGQ